jgi:hypothetical protein
MFLNLTIVGFKIFGHWELYAAAIGVVAIVALPKLFLALLADRFRFGDYPLSPHLFWLLLCFHFRFGFRELTDRVLADKMAGGLSAMFFTAFCEIFGTYLFILTLSPIILGLDVHAAWSLPWMLLFHDPIVLLKIVGLMVAASLATGLIPLVNAFESVHALLCSGIVLAFTVTSIDRISGVDVFPDFRFCVGILAVAFATKWLVILLLVGISMLARLDDSPKLLGILLGPLFNFLPVFIYGGWLALQIRAHLPIEP